MDNPFVLAIFFFLVAVFYSSVGFGGGSSYLALLYLAGVDLFILRSTGLMCNIIVVTSGTYIFYNKGYLNLKRSWPLVLASVPMAFLGGYIPLSSKFLFILLGLSLFFSSILLWFKPHRKPDNKDMDEEIQRPSGTPLAIALGSGIGFLSGTVGIGGGIFLAPILNLINWSKPKRIAALASLFILVNSLAGLIGQWIQHPPHIDLNWSWPLLLSVFLGGQIGSRLAVQKFSNTTIKRSTAVLVLFASLKILNDHFLGF